MKKRRTSLQIMADTFMKVSFEGAVENGFYPVIFAQASMPYKNPGKDLQVYQKTNGNFTVNITQGYDDFSNPIGYPYGVLPRLIILYLATETIKTKDKNISLGDNITDFLRRLNFCNNNKNRQRVIEQARRLFTCSFHFIGKREGHIFGQNINLINKYSLWVGNGKNDHTPDLFKAKVRLTDEFFNEFTSNNCFPVNIEQIRGIAESALAIDFYMWLTRRLYTLKLAVNIEWPLLHIQFGTEYKRQRKFVEKLTVQIFKIKAIWPELNLETSKGGITLKPSPLPVPRIGSF